MRRPEDTLCKGLGQSTEHQASRALLLQEAGLWMVRSSFEILLDPDDRKSLTRYVPATWEQLSNNERKASSVTENIVSVSVCIQTWNNPFNNHHDRGLSEPSSRLLLGQAYSYVPEKRSGLKPMPMLNIEYFKHDLPLCTLGILAGPKSSAVSASSLGCDWCGRSWTPMHLLIFSLFFSSFALWEYESFVRLHKNLMTELLRKERVYCTH